jgi:hypothetical protein
VRFIGAQLHPKAQFRFSQMPDIEEIPGLNFLSELYVLDSPDANLLAEYPSSNSDDTDYQNKTEFIIHDPFPPPKRELLKVLGPHHLMCGWGNRLPVTSQVAPPEILLEHWRRIFGEDAVPIWKPFDDGTAYITLFPHQSIPASQQVVDPVVNYALHSKEVIENIACPQADVLQSVTPPCIVKLSHGYAGLGNFLIKNDDDEATMRSQLLEHWPTATLVINSIIENIVSDFGVQFYLKRDGSVVWLGFTQQQFDANKKWCGGTFSAGDQTRYFEDLCQMIQPAGAYLHSCGYFGLVGIDILRDESGNQFLVDVNPRLTGISPFLIAARIFHRDDGLEEGIYQASVRFNGTYQELVAAAEETSDARVVVVSAFEDKEAAKATTICHLSVTSDSQSKNQEVLTRLLN